REAAGLSALAYVMAPRGIGHTGAGHLDLLYALAWWPWVMEAVGKAVSDQRSAGRKKKRRDKLKDALSIWLFASLVFLADARVSLFALSLATVYGVYSAVQSRQRMAAIPVGALAIFLLLTASVTVPLLLWRPYLSRADLTLADAGVFSLDWGHLIGLILPAH